MSRIEALPTGILTAGGAVLCLAALGIAFLSAEAALTGWLAAFAFTASLPLGGLCLTMMMRIIPGIWREELLTSAEAAVLLLPLTLIGALPVLAGLPWIYEWARGAQLTGFKKVYLTPAFFDLRTLFILGAACWLGGRLIARPDRALSLSAAGLIAFVLLHGILAVDWLMSLDPEFHSSGFGLYILAGQMLSALSMLIMLRLWTAPVRQPSILGALLLTAILFWAYLAFMQYFIIWSGNLTQGVVWFKRRGDGAWAIIEYLIALLHLVPLLLLLLPPVRAGRQWLMILSTAVLAGKLLEYAWLVFPSLTANLAVATLAYFLSLAGLGLLGLGVLSRAGTLLARLKPADRTEATG
jgi:hypothetical protein